MESYVNLLRIEQWIKNLFVFIPLFFSGKVLEMQLVSESIFAFFIFSITSSCIYIINDYLDIEADRKHPKKCKRPLASGAITKKVAMVMFIFLIFLDISLIYYGQILFSKNLSKFLIIITSYFIINLVYTLKLKRVAIVDIFIIAVGFVLRVFSGGYITGIYISQWAVLLTFVLALVLAIGKRRGELVNTEISGKTRLSLDGYNVQFADIALSISCALAVVCYIMFTLSPQIQQKFDTKIFYTVGFVLFAFLRYLQQTLVYNKTESPTIIVYKDRYIQITLLLWFITYLLLIYLNDETKLY